MEQKLWGTEKPDRVNAWRRPIRALQNLPAVGPWEDQPRVKRRHESCTIQLFLTLRICHLRAPQKAPNNARERHQ